MVNPTGYTALDMIGFTDQGAYSSSDNYVKNDLVHYSGNIWRCLIDDTSGIAPVEGVNWTLFIGEPTNLVERIIAPVETDPATNAWTVGRQIIFNDNLYEVIAAITAGDSLVTYEDDPTNANIKLADPVETQLLNVKGNLTNRNLLDNAWFTVNQRGQSSYTASTETRVFTVDRWATASGSTGGNTTVDVLSDGLGLTTANDASDNATLTQHFSNSFLFGKTCTFSAIINSIIYSKTITIPSNKTQNWQTAGSFTSSGGVIVLFMVAPESADYDFEYIIRTPKNDTMYTVRAVKLELGSISTLAMDATPNYATELLKCQRYFYRLESIGNNDWIALGKAWATGSVNVILNMPIMRTAPSTVVSNIDLIFISKGTSTMDPHRIDRVNFAYFKKFGHSGVLTLTLADTTATLGETYILKSESAVNIDFSADL